MSGLTFKQIFDEAKDGIFKPYQRNNVYVQFSSDLPVTIGGLDPSILAKIHHEVHNLYFLKILDPFISDEHYEALLNLGIPATIRFSAQRYHLKRWNYLSTVLKPFMYDCVVLYGMALLTENIEALNAIPRVPKRSTIIGVRFYPKYDPFGYVSEPIISTKGVHDYKKHFYILGEQTPNVFVLQFAQSFAAFNALLSLLRINPHLQTIQIAIACGTPEIFTTRLNRQANWQFILANGAGGDLNFETLPRFRFNKKIIKMMRRNIAPHHVSDFNALVKSYAIKTKYPEFGGYI